MLTDVQDSSQIVCDALPTQVAAIIAEPAPANNNEVEAKVEGEGAEGAEVTSAEEQPAKPKPRVCGICEKDDGKYKCPRCSLP